MVGHVNPYQSPGTEPDDSAVVDRIKPISFGGSMTCDEGQHVDFLMKGIKWRGPPGWISWLITVSMIFGLGWLGIDIVRSDEVDQLFIYALGLLAIVAVSVAVFWEHKHRQKLLRELKANESGIFTRIYGRLHGTGIEFQAHDFPIQYDWDDFVGYRTDNEVAILSVNFPTEVNFLAASWFDSRDEWKMALEMVKQHVPIFPMSIRKTPPAKNHRMTHIAAGIRHLNANAWKEALDEFDQALVIDPANAQALRGRVLALVGMRELDAAMTAINKVVVALGAIDPITRRLRAVVLVSSGQYQEALSDLDWILELDPNDPEALRDRGLVYLKLGRFEAAFRETSAALQNNPHDAVAFNNRGVTLIELGRVEEAIADLEQALKIDPQFERPKTHLARARELLVQV